MLLHNNHDQHMQNFFIGAIHFSNFIFQYMLFPLLYQGLLRFGKWVTYIHYSLENSGIYICKCKICGHCYINHLCSLLNWTILHRLLSICSVCASYQTCNIIFSIYCHVCYRTLIVVLLNYCRNLILYYYLAK